MVDSALRQLSCGQLSHNVSANGHLKPHSPETSGCTSDLHNSRAGFWLSTMLRLLAHMARRLFWTFKEMRSLEASQ
jgi:hypothetical protein